MVALPRPPYDAELAPIHAAIANQEGQLKEPLTVEAIVAYHANPSLLGLINEPSKLIGELPISHTERKVPGFLPTDPDVVISIFTPMADSNVDPTTSDALSRPCIYYMHGGGMVFMNRFTDLEHPLQWVVRTGCVLVTVEYRLAPENPQPALLHDCYAGLHWVHGHASELGLDSSRIMVAGHSGGSTLAAGLAMMARDMEDGPEICAQLLACPMLDDRNDTTSCMQYADEPPWDRNSNIVAWRAALSGVGGEQFSEYFVPAKVERLHGLPQTWVDVGSAEMMRDEAVAYASKLWAAGVQAELHVWPGAFHGFDVMAPEARLTKLAVQTKLDWIKRVFDVL